MSLNTFQGFARNFGIQSLAGNFTFGPRLPVHKESVPNVSLLRRHHLHSVGGPSYPSVSLSEPMTSSSISLLKMFTAWDTEVRALLWVGRWGDTRDPMTLHFYSHTWELCFIQNHPHITLIPHCAFAPNNVVFECHVTSKSCFLLTHLVFPPPWK